VLVLTQRSTPMGVASKPTRNGIVHPMIPFLIATSFTCSDAQVLIDRIKAYKVEEETKLEMIQVVKEEMSVCNWDAKAD